MDFESKTMFTTKIITQMQMMKMKPMKKCYELILLLLLVLLFEAKFNGGGRGVKGGNGGATSCPLNDVLSLNQLMFPIQLSALTICGYKAGDSDFD
ncbi:MAG: hypothetical protein EZS28_027678 [Streblomastix strix]|uniref:Uncharacterized protein n=1 Tax=Streblomastix strix TaxID=222440 RepID=A0A5J4V1E9_9EUKA|nr:MAG: hypothetical protein EZS28_027678 [Streblomastix strix]